MINALDVSLIDDTNYLNEKGSKLLQLNNIKKILSSIKFVFMV